MKRLILGTEDTELLAPYEYPSFVTDKDAMHANHWRPQEIGCIDDISDLRTKLSPTEGDSYVTRLAWLTFMDVHILDMLSMMKLISTAPEVSGWIGAQIGQEQNHQDAYQYLAEQLGLDQRDLYSRYLMVPSLKAKADLAFRYSSKVRKFLIKWLADPEHITDKDIHSLLLGVAFYGLGYEGVWFTGGFPPIFAFAERGLMLSTSKQLQYIWRDENMHVKGWTEWLLLAQKETGVTLSLGDIKTVLSEVLDAEERDAKEAMPAIVGYNADIHMRGQRNLANLRLTNLGFRDRSHHYPDAEPANFISKYQMQNEGNFFETRVTAYRTGGALDGTW